MRITFTVRARVSNSAKFPHLSYFRSLRLVLHAYLTRQFESSYLFLIAWDCWLNYEKPFKSHPKSALEMQVRRCIVNHQDPSIE